MADDSHKSRLKFEQIAGGVIVTLAAVYGAVGLCSDELAKRVVELAPALNGLATTIGLIMGASWFRGHMDQRISGDDK